MPVSVKLIKVVRKVALATGFSGLKVFAGNMLAPAGFTFLGMSGAALQGYTRNPLADPAVIGVSSGASLFAVLSLYSGLSLAFPLALPIAAIVGALLCVLLLLGLAGRGGMLTKILAARRAATSGAHTACW